MDSTITTTNAAAITEPQAELTVEPLAELKREDECPVCKDPTYPTHRECSCGGGSHGCGECDPEKGKIYLVLQEGVCMNHKQTVNGQYTKSTNTVARFKADGFAARSQRKGEKFAVVMASSTFTGDWIEQFITDFETDLKEYWRIMNQYIEEKSYGQARIYRDYIKGCWKPITDVHGLDRCMTGSQTVGQLPLWNIYTMRQGMNNYWNARLKDSFTWEHRRQLSRYCFDNIAVFFRMEECHEDAWLEDLWDEYGLVKLKKLRIPTKEKAATAE